MSQTSEITELSANPLDSERLQDSPLATARWLLEQSLLTGNYEQSLLHAHEPNLHSMMLYDFGPGEGKVRMFFAEGGKHQLATLRDQEDDLRCRVHDHRFNLALVPLLGEVLQISSEETDDTEAPVQRTKYQFGSAILGGVSNGFTFEPIGEVGMTADEDEILKPGDISLMHDSDLHSVNTTPEYSQSDVAWLVVEGTEQKSASVLYSAIPNLPPQMSAEGLYVPAGLSTARGIVRHVLESMESS